MNQNNLNTLTFSMMIGQVLGFLRLTSPSWDAADSRTPCCCPALSIKPTSLSMRLSHDILLCNTAFVTRHDDEMQAPLSHA
jgi:hypothetical protein